tara:strand:+ start:1770 stop:2780 length:1011 start_codon:yes stop_codon:yes gene_type:complete
MEATIVLDRSKHYPVLLKEIISIISPQYGGTFIDCTFGQGGYTKEILKFSNTKVIGIDRDIESIKIADQIKKNFEDRFLFKNIKFSQLKNLKLKNENIKGVLFDLGYSLNQIKDKKKGLSFSSKGQLNMKLGLNDFSAKDVVNKLQSDDLQKIFRYYGEEKEAKKIANKIVNERTNNEIGTQDLVNIIDTVKRRKNFKIHNSTKVFQALRIFVNKEISELIYGLINATKVLKKGGILAVVSFNSLEDKIVKYFFRSLSENKSISRYQPKIIQSEPLLYLKQRKPIIPSKEELSQNIPSRTAKLRFVVKKKDFYNFNTDVFEKFKSLIEVENISNKL